MRDDLLDVSPSTLSLPPRRSAAPQLLIEMQAEPAARLLVRSLVEQISQMASPLADVSQGPPSIARLAAWRTATHRLSASVSLYAEALTDSVSRKSRRRLQGWSRQAERQQRAEVQLAWLRPFLPEAPASESDAVADPSDESAAAAWLTRRVVRKQLAAGTSLRRASRDATKLRDLVRSLGVYTTALRLDDMPQPRSFASLTGRLLREEGELAFKHARDIRPGDSRSVRRACDVLRRIGYLLEPVRMHLSGASALSERLGELRTSIEQLVDLGTVANAILRAGRRAGALYMTSLLRTQLFETSKQESSEELEGATSTKDHRRGLLALAKKLNVEIIAAFERFGEAWTDDRINALAADLDAFANQLR